MTNINRSEIQSPCVRKCCLNENDVCLGCFRHVDEIIEWGPAASQRRNCILENARQRSVEYANTYSAKK